MWIVALAAIVVHPNYFEVNGKPTILRSGTFQWYRTPASEWPDRLSKFSSIYNTLDMYISWQYIEPKQNEFELESLKEFLSLVHQYDLYLIVRPGPYICNEENSGGIPEWVIAKSNKAVNPFERDGFYGLRTSDLDYLDIVERYFDAINQVIAPYSVHNGGNVILYSIENELDHFETFFKIDKWSRVDGLPERPMNATLDVTDYLNKLVAMAKKQIDVPITTCPGSIEKKGLGNADVLPLPNYYFDASQLEKVAMTLSANGGPVGITETFRSASTTARLIIGGLDFINNFNAFGFYSEGRKNAMLAHFLGVVKPTDIFQIIKNLFPIQTIKDIQTAFFRFPIGLMPNVIDFNGPVGPSGTIRPDYHAFRRLHLFMESFGATMALAGTGHRAKDSSIVNCHPFDCHWLPYDNGAIISLNLKKTTTISPHTFSFHNISFPIQPVRIPYLLKPLHIPENHVNDDSDAYETVWFPVNITVNEHRIAYSTCFLLHFDDPVLFIYSHSYCEMLVNDQILYIVPHDKPYQTAHAGLQLVYIPYHMAGKTFLTSFGWVFNVDHYDEKKGQLHVSSGFYHWHNGFVYHEIEPVPPFYHNVTHVRILNESFPTDFVPSEGRPEGQGITEGYVYYKAYFNTTQDNVKLNLGKVGDFCSLFLNGHHVTSSAPLGSGVKSNSWYHRKRFVVPSHLLRAQNEIILRVDIYGRGSFLFPRGQIGFVPMGNRQVKVSPISFRIDALAYDAVKGRHGYSHANKVPLTWSHSIGLQGEKEEWYMRLPNRRLTLPYRILPGALQFVNFRVPQVGMPIVLHLKGRDLKADIYMDGVVRGRWISDDGWLNRGSAYHVDRSGLSMVSMDDFPIPKGTKMISLALDNRGEGVLEELCFQDPKEIISPDGTYSSHLVEIVDWK